MTWRVLNLVGNSATVERNSNIAKWTVQLMISSQVGLRLDPDSRRENKLVDGQS